MMMTAAFDIKIYILAEMPLSFFHAKQNAIRSNIKLPVSEFNAIISTSRTTIFRPNRKTHNATVYHSTVTAAPVTIYIFYCFIFIPYVGIIHIYHLVI